MLENTVNVKISIEARIAAMFVQVASKYSSHIQVRVDDKAVNAKSIMGIISLGILEGQPVTLIADGEDEQQAINELQNFLGSV